MHNTHYNLEDVKVLVAESNFSQSRLFLKLLQEEGADVTLMSNGYELLDTVKKDLHVFDAIVMDLRLQGISGLRVTNQLREHGFSGVIIALSAFSSDELKLSWLKAGCNEYLEKPIYKAEFISAVASHTRSSVGSLAQCL